jgi:hypothetical protein
MDEPCTVCAQLLDWCDTMALACHPKRRSQALSALPIANVINDAHAEGKVAGLRLAAAELRHLTEARATRS